MLVSNAITVGGEEPALDSLALDGRLELRDAAVEGLFLCGGDDVAGGAGAAAAAVVPYSNGGKGGFNLREEFLYFVVLDCVKPSKMVEHPLENIVTVCGCGRKVVEMGVKIVGQVRALG